MNLRLEAELSALPELKQVRQCHGPEATVDLSPSQTMLGHPRRINDGYYVPDHASCFGNASEPAFASTIKTILVQAEQTIQDIMDEFCDPATCTSVRSILMTTCHATMQEYIIDWPGAIECAASS